MARMAVARAAACCLLSMTISSASAQTDAETLLANMIEARGGATKLAGIRTSVMRGKIVLVAQGGVSGDLVVTSMYPQKLLMEMTILGTKIRQGYDGGSAWIDNPVAGGLQQLPDQEREDMRRAALGDLAYLDPAAHGIRYEYLGTTTDDGTKFHVLGQTLDGGGTVTLYVDAESYLLRKTVVSKGTPQQAYSEETHYADYQVTEGVAQARAVTVFAAGQKVLEFSFDQFEYNPAVDVSAFQPTERQFTREELVADARQLASLLEDTHPDPYARGGGKIAFHRRLQHLLRAIPTEGLTRGAFHALLRPFVAAIGDGHTEVFSYHSVDTEKPGGIPLKFDAVERALVVSGVPDERYRHLLGAALVSVEGVSLEELGQRLGNLRPIDNHYHLLWHLATTYLRYGPYLQELLPEWTDAGRLRAGLELGSGQVEQVAFPLPMGVPATIGSSSRISLPAPGDSGSVYDFVGPGQRVAYVRIDHMKHYRESSEVRGNLGLEAASPEELRAMPSVTEFLRSLVTKMKDAGTEALIVDLRRNEGGDALMVDFLVYFLYGKDAVRQTRWSDVTRLSRTYLEARDPAAMDTLNKNRAVHLVEGDYDFSGDPFDDVLSADPTEDGGFGNTPTFAAEWNSGQHAGYYCPPRVVVLTSPWTFSAGFGIAIRLYRSGAILVGTPSGQAPNSGGNSTVWALNNTGIKGRVSQSYVINFPEGSELASVLPVHYPMTRELLAAYDFDANADVLYALDLLPELAQR